MSDRIPIQAMTVFTTPGTRSSQEDFALAVKEKGVFVVADGFGGPNAGAEASKAACEAVQRFLIKEAGDLEATMPFVLRSYFSLAGNVLFNALIHANRKVLALNKGKNIHQKGGASVLAGFMDGDLLALASVGGCEGYLLRDHQMGSLVVPRTYGRVLDPLSNKLAGDEVSAEFRVPLMAVGMVEDLEPEIVEYRVRPGDWLILNTDGLGPMDLETIRSIKLKELSHPATLDELNEYFKGLRPDDNLSLVLMIF